MNEDLIPSSLPDTQSQNPADVTLTLENEISVPQIWGRLYSTKIHLHPFDLIKNEFTLGRAMTCDVVISTENLDPRILPAISKIHFKIINEDPESCTPIVSLQDCSFNGTYVNGCKIGKGNRVLLQNDDEISIGYKTCKTYVFKSMSDHTKNIPSEISSRYIISKVLGVGICGEVKLVFDKRTNQRFALKKIPKTKRVLVKSAERDKVINEVRILKALRHPCVIHLEDIIDTDDAVYIVLELMEGGELFDRITSNCKLTEANAKLIFYQIVHAVKYLHKQGITHRDLKPENVLLSTTNKNTLVKVTDFGMSKILDKETIMRTVCGTPLYVAPEVLLTSGKGSYTKQVDVWSLGVMLYFALSGTLPFHPDYKEHGLNYQIINGMYTFPEEAFSDVSDKAIDLIKRMLTVNPAKRISVNEILSHEWMQDNIMRSQARSLMEADSHYYLIDLNENTREPDEGPLKRARIEKITNDIYTTVSLRNEV